MRSRHLFTAAAAALLAGAIAAGVSYATIPGPGNVYTACMLKGVGTIRLIDKSLPDSNLMSRCKPSLETEVSWNQAGQAGGPGQAGPAGQTGDKGDKGDPGDLALAGRACPPGSSVTGFDAQGGLICSDASPPPPPCDDPEGLGTDLGFLAGDRDQPGRETLVQSGSICAGDQEWFSFVLVEQDGQDFDLVDLTARITLEMAPAAGDLSLCVVHDNGAASTEQCSQNAGTSTEVVPVRVADSAFGNGDQGRFIISILGAGPTEANTYTLTIDGNA